MISILRNVLTVLVFTLLASCGEDKGADTDSMEQARETLTNFKNDVRPYADSSRQAVVTNMKAAYASGDDRSEASLLLAQAFFDLGKWAETDNWVGRSLELGGDPAVLLPLRAQALLNLAEYDKLDSMPFEGLDPEGLSVVQAAKAISLAYQGRFELATELADMARNNDPVSPFAELARARIAIELKQYNKAQVLLERILKQYPDYIAAWRLLGDVEGVMGRAAAAVRAYDKVNALGGESEDEALNSLLMKLYRGPYLRAASDIKNISDVYPQVADDPAFYFLEGLSLIQRSSKLHLPRRSFGRSIDKSYDFPQSFYYLAAIDLELGVSGESPSNFDLALSLANEFLGYFPESPAGLRLAAKVALVKGDNRQVENALKLHLRKHPDDIESLDILARARLADGRISEAIETYTTLMDLQPDSIEARARLGAAYLSSDPVAIVKVPQFLLLELDAENVVADPAADLGLADVLAEKESADEGIFDLQVDPGEGEGFDPERMVSSAEREPAYGSDLRPSKDGKDTMEAQELGLQILRDILAVYPGYSPADVMIVHNFLRQRRVDEAVEAAKEFLQRSPTSELAYNILGVVHLADGQRELAREAFLTVLELHPGEPYASEKLADLEIERGDFAAARKLYEGVLAVDNGHVPTLMKVAQSYAREGKSKDVLKTLERANLADPRALEPRLAHVRYHLAKNEPRSAIHLLDAFTGTEKSDPRTLHAYAITELALGRYDQALENLNKLMKVRPDVSQYHYLRARAYAGVGDYRRVNRDLQRALEIDPAHFYARLVQARLAHHLDPPERFAELLAELQEEAPNNLDVMLLEAAFEEDRDRHGAANWLYKNVFQRHRVTDSLVAYAGQRYITGDRAGAIDSLESWVEDNPMDMRVRAKLAELYARDDQHDNAIAQYRKMLRVDPGDVVTLNNLAWHLVEENALEALEHVEKAIRLSDGSSAMFDTLAMAQLGVDRVAEARRSIDRARKLDPHNPQLHYHDALILVAEEQSQTAKDTLTALLASNENFAGRPAAEALLAQLQ